MAYRVGATQEEPQMASLEQQSASKGNPPFEVVVNKCEEQPSNAQEEGNSIFDAKAAVA